MTICKELKTRCLRISVGKPKSGFISVNCEPREVSWIEFREELACFVDEEEKKNLPYFMQATFLANGARKSENVEQFSIVAFDVDGGQTFDEAEGRLAKKQLTYSMYTSFSHGIVKGKAAPCDRFRVVLPLREPKSVSAQEWKSGYKAIGRFLGLHFDSACSDAARLFYFPGSPRDRRRIRRSHHGEGAFMDYNSIVATENSPTTVASVANLRARSAEVGDIGEVTIVLETLAALDPCCCRQRWLRIIWALQSEFHGGQYESVVLRALVKWSSNCAEKFKVGEIEKLWCSAERKGEVTIGTFWYYVDREIQMLRSVI